MLLVAGGVAGAIPSLLVRVASSVAAVGVAGWAWSQLDCPPLLFLQDKWMHRSFFRLLRRQKQLLTTTSSSSSSSLHHQTLWIVGASSGIGEEFAYQWIQQLPRRQSGDDNSSNIRPSDETSHLILSARSTHKLQRVAANCRKLIDSSSSSSSTTIPTEINCQVRILPVDVTNYESLQQAVQDNNFPIKLEDIDMVLLNAGQGHLSPAVQTSPKACQQMLSVNALWPQWLVSLLWQQQQQQQNRLLQHSEPKQQLSSSYPSLPRLLVVSSVAGHIPVPLSAAYTASKFALVGYFRTLCCEDPTIQVTLFSPGPVETDFGKNRYQQHDHHSQNQQQQQQQQQQQHPRQDKNKMKLENASVSSTTAAAAAAVSNDRTNNSKGLKMSVQRCVRLMLTAMSYLHNDCRKGGYREVWISTQPALTVLYLQRWFPGFTQYLLTKHVGPKRVHLWRQGLDLYDPENWKNNK